MCLADPRHRNRGPSPRNSVLHSDENRLLLRVGMHRVDPQFTPDAASLATAIGAAVLTKAVLIDPHRAGPEPRNHPMRTTDVLGPYRGRQTEVSIVCDPNRVVLVLEPDNHPNGT